MNDDKILRTLRDIRNWLVLIWLTLLFIMMVIGEVLRHLDAS